MIVDFAVMMIGSICGPLWTPYGPPMDRIKEGLVGSLALEWAHWVRRVSWRHRPVTDREA
jgi:hypothetical protein